MRKLTLLLATLLAIVGASSMKAENYPVTIGNKVVTSENYTNISAAGGFSAVKSGTVTFDPATTTLTLDGAVLEYLDENCSNVILFDSPGTIVLQGTNSISAKLAAITITDDLTIKGGGSIYLTSENDCGLYVVNSSKLTIESCVVTAQGNWGIAGRDAKQNLSIDGAIIKATGKEGSICDFSQFSLENAAIRTDNASWDTAKKAVCNASGEVITSEVSITPTGPYAVLSEDGETLTFYYDAEEPAEGTVYDLPWDENSAVAPWAGRNITTVEFNESFADFHDFTNLCGMFYNITNLTTIKNLEYLNTENVTDMSSMFAFCEALKSLDLCSFNTEKVTDMRLMFANCLALEELDLSSFNTEKVTPMASMFASCQALTTIYCDKDWAKDGLASSFMFNGCKKLVGGNGTEYNSFNVDAAYAHPDVAGNPGYFTSVSEKPEAYAVLTVNEGGEGKTLTFYYNNQKPAVGGDISAVYDIPWGIVPGWRTNSTITTVTFDESFKDYNGLKNTSFMFYYLTKLETINNLENLNTEHVTDMRLMFFCCDALTSLDLGDNFDTSNVTDMSNMFYGCSSLKSLDLGDKFNTSNVTNMSMMFYSTKLTSLDVSSFDIAKVTNMRSMFNNCSNLETIYCAEGADWSGVEGRDYYGMFAGCEKLSGKFGSEEFLWNSEKIDGTYAKVYDGTNGGYFTYKGNRSYTLTVGEAEMATLYLDFDATIPEGVEVYCCTGLNDDEALPETYAVKITQGVIPANTGVFVKAAEGDYVFKAFIPVETAGVTQVLQIYPDNILTGTLVEKEVGSHEVLTLGYSNETSDLGFWWFTGKTPIPANRAYIPGDKLISDGGVKGIRLVFDDETSISLTPNPSPQGEGSWYSIDGRKMEGKPTQKGIYINNGRKVMVK